MHSGFFLHLYSIFLIFTSSSMVMAAALLLLVLFFSSASALPTLYVFGDSTVDPGNNNDLPNGLKANFLPYGIDFNNTPTGRFTNGLTAADCLATMKKLPLPPAYQSMNDNDRKLAWGINYGSAGCGILPKTKPGQLECFSFDQQIDLFNKTVVEDLAQTLPDPQKRAQFLGTSEFFISIGANDYIFTYPGINETDRPNFVGLLLDQLNICLGRLYDIGARNFIVNNIGPIGCLPSTSDRSNGKCDEEKNKLVRSYNDLLISFWLSDFLTFNPGANLMLADSYELFNLILASPSNYGFKNAKDACCGGNVNGQLACTPESIPCSNRDEFLFFDGSHTSQAANFLFAKLCIQGKICTTVNKA